jgi:hypothetical protein
MRMPSTAKPFGCQRGSPSHFDTFDYSARPGCQLCDLPPQTPPCLTLCAGSQLPPGKQLIDRSTTYVDDLDEPSHHI